MSNMTSNLGTPTQRSGLQSLRELVAAKSAGSLQLSESQLEAVVGGLAAMVIQASHERRSSGSELRATG
jgi:hypothetical protein